MTDAAQLIPDEHSRQAAEEASRTLAPLLKARDDTHAVFSGQKNHKASIEVVLPPVAIKVLVRALAELARGNAVTILPTHAELTTQQAADLLNVSRPYLIGLLEQREIPYRKVGNRRRILAADLFKYRDKMDEETRQSAKELTEEAQNLGLDY